MLLPIDEIKYEIKDVCVNHTSSFPKTAIYARLTPGKVGSDASGNVAGKAARVVDAVRRSGATMGASMASRRFAWSPLAIANSL